MLTKDDIQKKTKCSVRIESVPEWGGEVSLRELTVVEQLDLQSDMRGLVKDVPRDEQGKLIAGKIDRQLARKISIRYLSISLVDDDGQRMFTAEELDQMSNSQESVLERLSEIVFEMNSLKPDAVEQEAKNSDASPSDT